MNPCSILFFSSFFAEENNAAIEPQWHTLVDGLSLFFTDSSVKIINADGKMVRGKSSKLYFEYKLHQKGNSITKYKLLFRNNKLLNTDYTQCILKYVF